MHAVRVGWEKASSGSPPLRFIAAIAKVKYDVDN